MLQTLELLLGTGSLQATVFRLDLKIAELDAYIHTYIHTCIHTYTRYELHMNIISLSGASQTGDAVEVLWCISCCSV